MKSPSDPAKPRSRRNSQIDPELLTAEHDAVLQWAQENIAEVVFAAQDLGLLDGMIIPGDGSKWDSRYVQDTQKSALTHIHKVIQELLDQLDGTTAAPMSEKYVDALKRDLNRLKAWEGLGAPPKYQPFCIVNVMWQYLIMGEKPGQVLSTIDLEASLSSIRLSTNQYHDCYSAKIERVLAEQGGVDFYSPVTTPEWELEPKRFGNLHIEARTRIGSVGELLRQINLNRELIRQGRPKLPVLRDIFAVVSPDDKFRAVLESQGVVFVKCPVGATNI